MEALVELAVAEVVVLVMEQLLEEQVALVVLVFFTYIIRRLNG
jgi:hypothetical protein